MASIHETTEKISIADSNNLLISSFLGIIIILIGVARITYARQLSETFPLWLSVFLILFGIAFAALGHNEFFEVNKVTRKITIGKKYLWKNTVNQFDFKQVKSIILQSAIMHAKSSTYRYFLYLVFKDGKKETIPDIGGNIMMSTSFGPLTTQTNSGVDEKIKLGQKLAEAIGVPFEGEKVSEIGVFGIYKTAPVGNL